MIDEMLLNIVVLGNLFPFLLARRLWVADGFMQLKLGLMVRLINLRLA